MDCGFGKPRSRIYFDWVKSSQQFWFHHTWKRLQEREYNAKPNPQQGIAPEFQLKERYERSEARRYILCYYKLGVSSRRVKSVFVGHDHLNDFCGKHKGLNLCYGGGFGYHGYGKAGWSRRARVVVVDLNKKRKGKVGLCEINKDIDDEHLSVIDQQFLWINSANGSVFRRF